MEHSLNDAGIDSLWEFYFEKRVGDESSSSEMCSPSAESVWMKYLLLCMPYCRRSVIQKRTSSRQFKRWSLIWVKRDILFGFNVSGPHAFGSNDNREEYENPKQVNLPTM